MKKYTPLGSPCSPAWDDAWIAKVTETEERMGHCICGAKTPSVAALDAHATPMERHAYHAKREHDLLNGRNPDKPDPMEPWVPCILKPNSPNGRCRFHGGTDLTGGRPGNRNAAIHGLYTRALRPCSTSCPLWDKCPLAGNDVAQMRPAQRPTCPYEKADYNTALSDTLKYANALAPLPRQEHWATSIAHGPATQQVPHLAHLARHTALLHVMVQRAATAMREHPLVETVETKFADNATKYSRPHAYLQAFLRLSSEHRRYIDLLEKTAKVTQERLSLNDLGAKERQLRAQQENADHQRRTDNDTLLTPEAEALLEIPDAPIHDAHTDRMLEIANTLLEKKSYDHAYQIFNALLAIDPKKALPLYDHFQQRREKLRCHQCTTDLAPKPQPPESSPPPPQQPDPPPLTEPS